MFWQRLQPTFGRGYKQWLRFWPNLVTNLAGGATYWLADIIFYISRSNYLVAMTSLATGAASNQMSKNNNVTLAKHRPAGFAAGKKSILSKASNSKENALNTHAHAHPTSGTTWAGTASPSSWRSTNSTWASSATRTGSRSSGWRPPTWSTRSHACSTGRSARSTTAAFGSTSSR